MTPTTEPAIRIAKMFNRRLTTSWGEKEIRAYKRLVKEKCFTALDDLELIERYYSFQRRKGEQGIHRRDLLTFLNNYQGEFDRARAWDSRRQFERSKPKVNGNGEKPLSDTEFQRIGQLARQELERFKNNFK